MARHSEQPTTARGAEKALCERVAAGDAQAQAVLYRDYSGRVFAVAMRMLCQRSAAEEVLQDTFVRVFTRIAGFRGESALSTWITRIAVNECLQYLRSPWHRRTDVMVDSPAEQERPDYQLDLERALAQLSAPTRAVIWLHDVEGYKHREIAELMGQSVSFSKSRLARGHRQLRDILDPEAKADPCMPALNNS